MLSEAKHQLANQTQKGFFAPLGMTRSKKLAAETRIYVGVLRSVKGKALCCFMLFAAGAFAINALAASPAAKPTLEQVGNQVYCQCGCVTTLNHCPHLPSECQSRAEMQGTILSDIKQGKDDKAILADLVDNYGVHVLASPPAAGFDLTVWVLPGVGLIIGLVLVMAFVRRWRAKVAVAAPDCAIDPKIMAAVEEEMHKAGTIKG